MLQKLADLSDALSRLIVGHNTTDNFRDWKNSHKKANQSRAEANQAIEEAKLLQEAEKYKKG